MTTERRATTFFYAPGPAQGGGSQIPIRKERPVRVGDEPVCRARRFSDCECG